MSIRFLQRILRNGRSLLFADKRYCLQYRSVQNIAFKKSVQQESILAEIHATRDNSNLTRFSRRFLIENVLNRVTSPKSSFLRTEATKRWAFGDSLPFLSLIGCNLASGNVLITKEDELESICWEIRNAAIKQQNKFEEKTLDSRLKNDVQLSDLEIGTAIAKGCSAVVYAANFKETGQKSDENDNNAMKTQNVDEVPSTSSYAKLNDSVNSSILNVQDAERQTMSISPRNSDRKNTGDHEEMVDSSLFAYPWALKMMFNYDIQSNAMAILKAMYKETLPARCRSQLNGRGWENHLIENTLILPPHPNLVLMPTFFCDTIPDNLENSHNLFPNALPARLNPFSGYGRNMSLFILMKRYNCSLREYLSEAEITTRTRIILFAQLLEAIAHINDKKVAHRDLKSDNILIDTTSDTLPLLVLSDFGCCLADNTFGLKVPYPSGEIDKGGNVQLMAPEIVLKQPSIFSMLDYTKSDLWAAGTIAYEIFGYSNPFYNDMINNNVALRNVDYEESMLPELGDEVPDLVKKLIDNILERNPRRRLDCDVAANVLELYLWAPSSWIKYNRVPSNNEILEWLLSLTTKILCEQGLGEMNKNFVSKNRRTYTEYVLISTFLSRAKLRNIRKALEWIQAV